METGTQLTTLDSLAEEVLSYYKQGDFSPQHIQKFCQHVEKIRQFIIEKGFSTFSAVESEQFIRSIIADGEYKRLSHNEKSAIRCANVLMMKST